jgi:hypothetical protein
MMERRVLLDPTSEAEPAERALLARPPSLDGLTIGLLSISKRTSDVFLDAVESHFEARGLETARFVKPTFARPAPLALRQEIAARCDVVVEALAD